VTEGNDQGCKSWLPAMYPNSGCVEMGGLVSYATDMLRRAATYIDTIAKRAKVADLPAEQPMKFEFVLRIELFPPTTRSHRGATQLVSTLPFRFLHRFFVGLEIVQLPACFYNRRR
jgi:hypothetical protein